MPTASMVSGRRSRMRMARGGIPRASTAALLLALVFVVALPAGADRAEVLRGTLEGCDVNTDGLSDDGNELVPADCESINVATPNGGYTLIQHGQHPDYPYDHATSVETKCLVNIMFWTADQYPTGGAVFVYDGVRHFSATGHMTEICHYRPGDS